jgi:hypothetical protein
LRFSEHSGVGETVELPFAKNDVVKNSDAENVASFNEPFGTFAIFSARSRIA